MTEVTQVVNDLLDKEFFKCKYLYEHRASGILYKPTEVKVVDLNVIIMLTKVENGAKFTYNYDEFCRDFNEHKEQPADILLLTYEEAADYCSKLGEEFDIPNLCRLKEVLARVNYPEGYLYWTKSLDTYPDVVKPGHALYYCSDKLITMSSTDKAYLIPVKKSKYYVNNPKVNIDSELLEKYIDKSPKQANAKYFKNKVTNEVFELVNVDIDGLTVVNTLEVDSKEFTQLYCEVMPDSADEVDLEDQDVEDMMDSYEEALHASRKKPTDKGYYEGGKALDTIPDIKLTVHKFTHNNQSYFTVQNENEETPMPVRAYKSELPEVNIYKQHKASKLDRGHSILGTYEECLYHLNLLNSYNRTDNEWRLPTADEVRVLSEQNVDNINSVTVWIDHKGIQSFYRDTNSRYAMYAGGPIFSLVETSKAWCIPVKDNKQVEPVFHTPDEIVERIIRDTIDEDLHWYKVPLGNKYVYYGFHIELDRKLYIDTFENLVILDQGKKLEPIDLIKSDYDLVEAINDNDPGNHDQFMLRINN